MQERDAGATASEYNGRWSSGLVAKPHEKRHDESHGAGGDRAPAELRKPRETEDP